MSSDAPLPALRPLSITPFRHADGRIFFELRDMLQIAPRPVAISGPGCLILAHLDGTQTIPGVQEVFRRESGQEIPRQEIEQLVAVLDHYTLLDTPRFAEAFAAQQEAYRAAPYRDDRDRWPSAEELRSQIERMLSVESAEPVGELRGLIAPHLDYARGAPCYAAAYSALAQTEPADRYVILGTNHFGRSASAVATRKDFRTPLGIVPTDREFIRRLEERLGAEICDGELDHRSEHSIELQVHILQVCQGDLSFEMVPILCPDICSAPGTVSGQETEPTLDDLADALADMVSRDPRRTMLIAGADLSHVGQSFGDDRRMTTESLAEVESEDRRLLAMIAGDDLAGFRSSISVTANPTSICSTGCIYAFRRSLPGGGCRVLRYHQALDPRTQTCVSCAALVVH